MVHAGLVPQWTVALTLSLALEVSSALRHDPRALFDHMYGNEPDRWHERLAGMERVRFAINVLDASARVHRRRSGGLHQEG